MARSKAPPPSKAAERLKEYLDIVDAMQLDNGLIEGNKEEGYRKTDKGQAWHDILKRHRDLVGVLTRELSGDRRKQW